MFAHHLFAARISLMFHRRSRDMRLLLVRAMTVYRTMQDVSRVRPMLCQTAGPDIQEPQLLHGAMSIIGRHIILSINNAKGHRRT